MVRKRRPDVRGKRLPARAEKPDDFDTRVGPARVEALAHLLQAGPVAFNGFRAGLHEMKLFALRSFLLEAMAGRRPDERPCRIVLAGGDEHEIPEELLAYMMTAAKLLGDFLTIASKGG